MDNNELANSNRLELLVNLVEELKKDEPNEKTLRKSMRQVGLKYQGDHIDIIADILSELNNYEFNEGK